jgi:hypothetical protein
MSNISLLPTGIFTGTVLARPKSTLQFFSDKSSLASSGTTQIVLGIKNIYKRKNEKHMEYPILGRYALVWIYE